MQEFKRLLKYLKPNISIFIVAFVTMIIGAFFETARLGLLKPVFEQVYCWARAPVNYFFGLEEYVPESWIPTSSVEAWSTIESFLLHIYKAVADYFPSI